MFEEQGRVIMRVQLFDTFTTIMENELKNQLSPYALTVFNELSDEINAIYRIASISDKITSRDIAIIRQINDIRKNFIGESVNGLSKEDRDNACWQTFLNANDECAQQNLNFESLSLGTMHALEIARLDLDKVFWAHVESEESEFAWDYANNLIPISGFSTGPGSCTGVVGTSVLEKYRATWSTSALKGKKYLEYLRKVSKPIKDLPFFAVEIVVAILASLVPKNSETSRLVAPQLNGDLYLQYPAESFLRSMLRYFRIDLETQQQKNRDMARNGSLFDNCDIYDHSFKRRKIRYCTIDLSSASDLIGIELCKYLFPVPLANYMLAVRSDFITRSQKDTMVELHMMATMGNAFCFPMQTLVFLALVRAVYKQLNLPLEVDGIPSYGVYGDDIIVDVTAYDPLCKLLSSLKMKPNLKKCFSTGFFRESCGGDYFQGYDVRPVFCQNLRDDCSKYSLINRLVDWGVSHSVCVSECVGYLLSTITIKTVVPMDRGTHQGLRTPAAALAYLPREWRRQLECTALLDRNAYTYYVSRETVIDNFFSVWRNRDDLKRVGSSNGFTPVTPHNLYLETRYYLLDKVSPSKSLRLSKKEVSTFPFLRGGIQQSKLSKTDELRATEGRQFGCSARVPYRRSDALLQFVRAEDLEGYLVEGEYVTTSQWDIAQQELSASYIRYYGHVFNHYSHQLIGAVDASKAMRWENT